MEGQCMEMNRICKEIDLIEGSHPSKEFRVEKDNKRLREKQQIGYSYSMLNCELQWCILID